MTCSFRPVRAIIRVVDCIADASIWRHIGSPRSLAAGGHSGIRNHPPERRILGAWPNCWWEGLLSPEVGERCTTREIQSVRIPECHRPKYLQTVEQNRQYMLRPY